MTGQATKGGTSTDFDTPANEGTICTKACTGAGDCEGIAFATQNGYTVASEGWSCSGGICAVRLTPVAGGGNDACSGCGGAFCSGKCIGCPQC